ncbi:AAA+ family ATPase [Thioclava pacifica]|uniref:AAA+ family ATPase n=1 Tax=Thioclava pacifica DSM 10166 TaxID=1353537 RepID=A0A074JJZ4_9RHOB|nr:AAA+ family ATPase [Thioclava pacifica]KEO56175.1 hypothetical protein TP2_01250 [Thioclava pacifica DSM 10166]
MKSLLVSVLAFGLMLSPAAAQEEKGDVDRGFSLLEEGAQLLFRGLIEDMKPELEDMQKGLGEAASQLGPKLRQFLALIDDVKNYEAPERLSNGDIILRRKSGAPPPPPLLTEPPEEDAPRKSLPPGHPPVPDADGAIDL